jgi:hypothetical protein
MRRWYQENKDRAHRYDRKYDLKKNYGITIEEYDRILAEQGGGCAICGADVSDGRKRYLDIDHCHESGRVRGILCSNCNRGIGCFLDTPERCRAAAEYLERVRSMA